MSCRKINEYKKANAYFWFKIRIKKRPSTLYALGCVYVRWK